MPDKKMKFHEIGQKRRRPDITSDKNEVETTYYPGMTFNEKQLPFLKGKNQGDEVQFLIKGHITGKREAEEWDDDKSDHHTLEFKEIAEYE